MNFLRPEELLQSGYKECLLCEGERKGEEKRCLRCSGKAEQRDRLLWEINRERIRRNAARLSLAYPGAGHFYRGRDLGGVFLGPPAPSAGGSDPGHVARAAPGARVPPRRLGADLVPGLARRRPRR